MDKVDTTSNSLIMKVIEAQSEQQRRFEEVERERMMWEAERAQVQDEKDRAVINMFTQLVERLAPAQSSTATSSSHALLHENMYRFVPEE